MFNSIFQADLVSVISIQIALWLFGAALFYCFIRYTQSGTAETDINPVDLFLTLLSGEEYDTMPSADCSFW